MVGPIHYSRARILEIVGKRYFRFRDIFCIFRAGVPYNLIMLHKLQTLAELTDSAFLSDAIAQAIASILSGRTINASVYRALEGMVFAELETEVSA